MPYADPVKRAEYAKTYRSENRSRLTAQTRKWKQQNKERTTQINTASHYKRCSEDVTHYIKYLVKYSRKRRPDTHSLTHEDVVALWSAQNGRCALTGIPMTHEVKSNGGKPLHTNISIDRLDTDKGYSPDNVRLVCWIANVMRRDLTTEAFVGWCRLIVTHNDERNHHAPRPSEPET